MHYDDSARPLESAAALLGRLLLVALFLTQGWVKLMAGPDVIGGYFVKVGVPAPMLASYVVVAVELLLAAIFLVGWTRGRSRFCSRRIASRRRCLATSSSMTGTSGSTF